MGRVRPGVLVALVVAVGALRPVAWMVWEWRRCVGGICGVSGTPPEWDFAIFWVAGRLARLGDFARIFGFDGFHSYILQHFHYDVGLSPFAYAPVALLVFAPLAGLSLGTAYGVWVVGGLVALVGALRVAGLRWGGCVMVCCGAPVLYNEMLGQNGVLMAAVLVGALGFSGRRPAVAGVLGALFLMKPQIGLLVPAAWLGGRRFLGLGVAVGGVVGLVGVSVVVFGWAPWVLWWREGLPEMGRVMDAPYPQPFQVSAVTVFMFLRGLGVGVGAAQAVQVAAAAGAMVLVYWVGRRDFGVEKRLALVLLLAPLAMPYGYVYDLVGYSVALVLVWQWRGFSWVWAGFWVWPAVARDVTLAGVAPLSAMVVAAAFVWVATLGEPERRLS